MLDLECWVYSVGLGFFVSLISSECVRADCDVRYDKRDFWSAAIEAKSFSAQVCVCMWDCVVWRRMTYVHTVATETNAHL